MKCKHVDPASTTLKKIYRKAKPLDIAKWQEAIAREQETMIQARRIAAELGLDMKIGDVEFQGDGTKAIFYYIADGRVDFRQLIKVFAEEFRIRIEMKQIGARQEAGLIGGLGVCGRELCCANYITNFQSISTSAARTQDLSSIRRSLPTVRQTEVLPQLRGFELCRRAVPDSQGIRTAGIPGRAGLSREDGHPAGSLVLLLRKRLFVQSVPAGCFRSPENHHDEPERRETRFAEDGTGTSWASICFRGRRRQHQPLRQTQEKESQRAQRSR